MIDGIPTSALRPTRVPGLIRSDRLSDLVTIGKRQGFLTIGQIFNLPAGHLLADLRIKLPSKSDSGLRRSLKKLYLEPGNDIDFMPLISAQTIKNLDQVRLDLPSISQIRQFAQTFGLGLSIDRYAEILENRLYDAASAALVSAGTAPAKVKVAVGGAETVKAKIDIDKLLKAGRTVMTTERRVEIEALNIASIVIVDDDVDNVESVREFMQMQVDMLTGKNPDAFNLSKWQNMSAAEKQAYLSQEQFVILTAQTEAEISGLPAYIQSEEGQRLFNHALSILDYNYYEYPQLELTGSDMAKAIRASSPSVIMGMTGEAGNLKRFLDSGIDVVVLKPVKPLTLYFIK